MFKICSFSALTQLLFLLSDGHPAAQAPHSSQRELFIPGIWQCHSCPQIPSLIPITFRTNNRPQSLVFRVPCALPPATASQPPRPSCSLPWDLAGSLSVPIHLGPSPRATTSTLFSFRLIMSPSSLGSMTRPIVPASSAKMQVTALNRHTDVGPEYPSCLPLHCGFLCHLSLISCLDTDLPTSVFWPFYLGFSHWTIDIMRLISMHLGWIAGSGRRCSQRFILSL